MGKIVFDNKEEITLDEMIHSKLQYNSFISIPQLKLHCILRDIEFIDPFGD